MRRNTKYSSCHAVNIKVCSVFHSQLVNRQSAISKLQISILCPQLIDDDALAQVIKLNIQLEVLDCRIAVITCKLINFDVAVVANLYIKADTQISIITAGSQFAGNYLLRLQRSIFLLRNQNNFLAIHITQINIAGGRFDISSAVIGNNLVKINITIGVDIDRAVDSFKGNRCPAIVLRLDVAVSLFVDIAVFNSNIGIVINVALLAVCFNIAISAVQCTVDSDILIGFQCNTAVIGVHCCANRNRPIFSSSANAAICIDSTINLNCSSFLSVQAGIASRGNSSVCSNIVTSIQLSIITRGNCTICRSCYITGSIQINVLPCFGSTVISNVTASCVNIDIIACIKRTVINSITISCVNINISLSIDSVVIGNFLSIHDNACVTCFNNITFSIFNVTCSCSNRASVFNATFFSLKRYVRCTTNMITCCIFTTYSISHNTTVICNIAFCTVKCSCGQCNSASLL